MAHSISTVRLYKDYTKIGGRSFFSGLLGRKNEVQVIKNSNFEVKSGEFCAIFGGNGCGKTTMIKLLSTLLFPTRGHVYIDGYDIYKSCIAARKLIGFVSSNSSGFYMKLTGRQNLDFFGQLNNLPGKRTRCKIDELSEILRFRPYLDTMFYEYSTGIRQRFSIARSLFHDPQIMLYDEPFRSLDSDICKDLESFLRVLVKRQERILLFTTLKRDEAVLADRVFTIKNGVFSEEKLFNKKADSCEA